MHFFVPGFSFLCVALVKFSFPFPFSNSLLCKTFLHSQGVHLQDDEDIRRPLLCRLPAGWHLYNYLYVVFSFGSIKPSWAYLWHDAVTFIVKVKQVNAS